jgi:hypothetical protein
MATYRIIDLPGDDLEASSLDAEETLDFVLAHPGETFAFGEFEVPQSGAVSRMKYVYGVSR